MSLHEDTISGFKARSAESLTAVGREIRMGLREWDAPLFVPSRARACFHDAQPRVHASENYITARGQCGTQASGSHKMTEISLEPTCPSLSHARRPRSQSQDHKLSTHR